MCVCICTYVCMYTDDKNNCREIILWIRFLHTRERERERERERDYYYYFLTLFFSILILPSFILYSSSPYSLLFFHLLDSPLYVFLVLNPLSFLLICYSFSSSSSLSFHLLEGRGIIRNKKDEFLSLSLVLLYHTYFLPLPLMMWERAAASWIDGCWAATKQSLKNSLSTR